MFNKNKFYKLTCLYLCIFLCNSSYALKFFPQPVLFCTMLAQAQTAAEKKKIEQQMSDDPELSVILKMLQATDQDDIVSEERARRQQARQTRVAADIEAMDVEEEEVGFDFFMKIIL